MLKIVGLTTLALIAGISVRAYIDFQNFAQDRVVEIGASYKTYADVAAMTRDADMVVLGRVVGDGTTHLVRPPVEQPRAFQPAAVPEKADARGEDAKLEVPNVQPPTGPPSQASDSQQFDIPVTVYKVSVERVVRGPALKGNDLLVSQPGGKLSTPTFPGGPRINRTLQFEHDTPLAAGDRQLMFLHDAGDGTYYVVGGPQGRLRVDQTDKVHPIDRGTPAVRGREGQGVEGLAAEVAAVR